MRTLTLILLFCSSALIAQISDSLILANDGKTNYQIQIISQKASDAANLAQKYIDTICGVSIPITQKKNKRHPSIIFLDNIDNRVINDGFKVETDNKNIIIRAINSSGFNNAVYYLLEQHLGCRYYAPNAKKVPKQKEIKIAKFSTTQNPSFDFRINYNGSAFDKGFADWHGLHNKPLSKTNVSFDISDNWGMWVHTLHRLLPIDPYFSTHPEYFALRNGTRIPDQLCLSNPAVLDIVVTSLRKEMANKPTAKYWSVSQLDNFNYCQCDRCKAIDSINESPSGSIITFVNAIAQEFPDKIISTLAYQFSRKAPKLVKPLPNVNIMLCTIECDRHKPIATDESIGGFKYDLQEWGKLTSNILVWDYVINFSNIIGPFPNFHVLKPNLLLFKENNVTMLFEQGWARHSGEFVELRSYLLAKLMWNPSLDVDSLMQDFCMGFYGSGGKFIYDYIQLSTQNLKKSGRPLTLYEPMSAHGQGFLSPRNTALYFNLLNQALVKTKNDSVSHHRIDMAMQPIRYAWLEVAKSLPFTDDWIFVKNREGNNAVSPKAEEILKKLCDMATLYGPTLFHEIRLTPQEYFDRMKAYFATGYQHHKAIGKTITFASPYASKYAANGQNSLIDGVCGTENYFCLWQGWNGEDMEATIDLGKPEKISIVSLNALCDHMSWIFPPDSIIVMGSSDGKTFQKIGLKIFSEAKSKSTNGIIPFEIKIDKAIPFRYIKVNLNNIGRLPEWRGVDGNAWLFVDEIMIK